MFSDLALMLKGTSTEGLRRTGEDLCMFSFGQWNVSRSAFIKVCFVRVSVTYWRFHSCSKGLGSPKRFAIWDCFDGMRHGSR